MLPVFLILIFFSGCAALTKNYAVFHPTREATAWFEEQRIPEGHRFYLTGSHQYPTAILALRKDLTVKGDLWWPVEMTPALLKEKVTAMQTQASYLGNQHLFGFVIRDEKGEVIGFWYSVLRAVTSAKREGNLVTVTLPPLDVYERRERWEKRLKD
jgi:hypothetical protein